MIVSVRKHPQHLRLGLRTQGTSEIVKQPVPTPACPNSCSSPIYCLRPFLLSSDLLSIDASPFCTTRNSLQLCLSTTSHCLRPSLELESINPHGLVFSPNQDRPSTNRLITARAMLKPLETRVYDYHGREQRLQTYTISSLPFAPRLLTHNSRNVLLFALALILLYLLLTTLSLFRLFLLPLLHLPWLFGTYRPISVAVFPLEIISTRSSPINSYFIQHHHFPSN